MQNRKCRFERVIGRVLHRFQCDSVLFYCNNGVASIEAYLSRPMFLEDTNGSMNRATASYEWIVTGKTFHKMRMLAGKEGLFDEKCYLEYDGNKYRFDRLTPYQSLSLSAGYRLLTQKVNETR